MAASRAPNHTEAEKAIGELVLRLQVLDPCHCNSTLYKYYTHILYSVYCDKAIYKYIISYL